MNFLKNKLAVTVLLLAVTFCIVIGVTASRNKATSVESGAVYSINTVQGFLYSINTKVKDIVSYMSHFTEIKAQNDELTKENSELKDKADQYDALQKENDDLKAMLDFTKKAPDYQYKGCNITGKPGAPWLQEFIIDIGTKQGILPGMAVLDNNGYLVGQVTFAASDWARVGTLANGNIAVGGKVASSDQSNGIVSGYKDSDNKLMAKLNYLPKDSNVKNGDEVSTSGDGQIYPPNIKIGTAVDVQVDNSTGMKTVAVEPYVDLNKVEKLLIVIPKDSKDIKY